MEVAQVNPTAVVLGADTLVALEGKVIGYVSAETLLRN